MDLLLKREELFSSGVYILAGTDLETGQPMAYIGEAESVAARLKQHLEKDWWNSVIAFVSKDENLTKAHTRYLERRLIEECRVVGRYRLENAASGSARLPESDTYDMEAFVERCRQLLPVMGSELLTPVSRRTSDRTQPKYTCRMKSAIATGDRTPNGFVVYKGSTAVREERPSAERNRWVLELRQRLIDEGVLDEHDGLLRFTRDTEFSSPSAAAAVVYGGTAAGPVAWKDSHGRTLKEIERGLG